MTGMATCLYPAIDIRLAHLRAAVADMELEYIHDRRVVRFIQRLAELAPETRP